jgi:hypothetical protein
LAARADSLEVRTPRAGYRRDETLSASPKSSQNAAFLNTTKRVTTGTRKMTSPVDLVFSSTVLRVPIFVRYSAHASTTIAVVAA